MHNQRFDHAAAIGEVLREVMSERGVTQLELSQRVGVTQTTIWRHLDGRHDTPVGFLARICEALDTTMIDVLNRVNSRYCVVAA